MKLATFETTQDEANTWQEAETKLPAFTGYMHGLDDTDYFRLNLGQGTFQISVLPDLARIYYPPDLPAGVGLPSGVVLEQETIASARVLELVINPDGSEAFATTANLEAVRDDLAMQGQTTTHDINFYRATVTFQGSRTEFGAQHTGQYFLEVDGQAVPLVLGTAQNPVAFTQEAGRYLVTIDNPTGQRSTNWGGWIETYDYLTGQGDGDGVIPPGDEPSADTPLPTIMGTNGVDYDAGQSVPGEHTVFGSPGYYFNEDTQTWSIPDFNIDLSYIGPGRDALFKGMKDEFVRSLDETFRNIADSKGLSYFRDLSKQIRIVSELKEELKKFPDTVFEAIRTFGTPAEMNGDDFDRRVSDDTGRLMFRLNELFTSASDLPQTAKTGLKQVLSSIRMTAEQSNISFTYDFDVRSTKQHLESFGHRVTFVGSEGGDVFRTHDAYIVIGDGSTARESHSDVMYGGAGNDFLAGDGAGDVLIGGPGHDQLQGQDGNDFLWGNAGNDTLIGGSDNDTLVGGAGADTLNGGAGNDFYRLASEATGSDTIIDLAGIDTVLSTISRDLNGFGTIENLVLQGTGAINGVGNSRGNGIQGNVANNRLYGGAGNDALNGGTGNDLLVGGPGNDTLIGGPGNDTFVLGDEAHGVDTMSDVSGSDTVTSTISRSIASLGTIENLTLEGAGAINGRGNALGNLLRGNQSSNSLVGDIASDMLLGGGGDDRLFGDVPDVPFSVPSADRGSYVLAVEPVPRWVALREFAIAMDTGFSLSPDPTIANPTTNPHLSISPIGDGTADYFLVRGITGRTVTIDIDGAGPTFDSLIELVRSDGYLVAYNDDSSTSNGALGSESALDSFLQHTFGDNAEYWLRVTALGSPAIPAGASYTLHVSFADVVLSSPASGHDILRGESGNDQLFGGRGNDTLNGGPGIDTLDGGFGNDLYELGDEAQGIDKIIDPAGLDTVLSTITRSIAPLATIENLLLLGSSNIDGAGNGTDNGIMGNDANNVLYGSAGNDTLNGRSGNDRVYGQAGQDSMIGGEGNDYFVFEKASDSPQGPSADLVYDFDDNGNDLIVLRSVRAGMSFIGQNAFTGINQVRINDSAGPHLVIEINLVGNATPEMQIALFNTSIAQMGSDDIFL